VHRAHLTFTNFTHFLILLLFHFSRHLIFYTIIFHKISLAFILIELVKLFICASVLSSPVDSFCLRYAVFLVELISIDAIFFFFITS